MSALVYKMSINEKERFRQMLASKHLTGESEWMRVYQLAPGHDYSESKFLADGLEISAEVLKKRWPLFTSDEQKEFIQAYREKPQLSGQDHQILRYLMEAGTDDTWSAIADRLTELPERKRVL